MVYPAYTPARFWSKVDKSGGPGACWPWQGGRSDRGYGKLKWRGRHRRAHTVAYELTHGPIPPTTVICHTCDNPPCCNSLHLFAGTQGANIADKIAKNRQRRAEENGRAKLDWAKVRAIRARVTNGEKYKPLAREFGVADRTIKVIARGITWRE